MAHNHVSTQEQKWHRPVQGVLIWWSPTFLTNNVLTRPWIHIIPNIHATKLHLSINFVQCTIAWHLWGPKEETFFSAHGVSTALDTPPLMLSSPTAAARPNSVPFVWMPSRRSNKPAKWWVLRFRGIKIPKCIGLSSSADFYKLDGLKFTTDSLQNIFTEYVLVAQSCWRRKFLNPGLQGTWPNLFGAPSRRQKLWRCCGVHISSTRSLLPRGMSGVRAIGFSDQSQSWSQK